MSTFLIIGGTGKVGARLAAHLRAAGHHPRIASRTGGDVRFDWADSDTFASALRGVEGVFVVGPGSATDWSPRLRELLAVAAEEHVQRAVFLSARGVEFLPDGAVARAETALREGPIGWVILRPTHFAQNFTEAMFVPVNGEVIAPVASGAEPFVDVEDIAEVAAVVLASPDWQGDTIEISGPAALTFDEAVAVLSAQAGAEYRFVDESAAAHAERLRAAGTPDGYITWRLAMLGGISSGADAYLSDGASRILGRRATSFAEWATREVPLVAAG